MNNSKEVSLYENISNRKNWWNTFFNKYKSVDGSDEEINSEDIIEKFGRHTPKKRNLKTLTSVDNRSKKETKKSNVCRNSLGDDKKVRVSQKRKKSDSSSQESVIKAKIAKSAGNQIQRTSLRVKEKALVNNTIPLIKKKATHRLNKSDQHCLEVDAIEFESVLKNIKTENVTDSTETTSNIRLTRSMMAYVKKEEPDLKPNLQDLQSKSFTSCLLSTTDLKKLYPTLYRNKIKNAKSPKNKSIDNGKNVIKPLTADLQFTKLIVEEVLKSNLAHKLHERYRAKNNTKNFKKWDSSVKDELQKLQEKVSLEHLKEYMKYLMGTWSPKK